ncbi:MAG: nuclear transport factor 2 family protein [Burkholderiaceae bacterium]
MYIFWNLGLASYRWLPLGSNVRPHNARVPLVYSWLLQMNDVESHLLELSQKIVEIELRRDADALADLICEDYLGVDPSGALIDKSTSVGRYRNPDFTLTQHGVEQVQIVNLGESALEVGIMPLAGHLGTFEFGGSYRYTHLWLKTREGWKVRAPQLTPMRPSAA